MTARGRSSDRCCRRHGPGGSAGGGGAGSSRCVSLSMVWVDRVDSACDAGRRAQEHLVLSGPVPATVLRATQFHVFLERVLELSRGPIGPVPVMRLQPVAAQEMAEALAALVPGPPTGRAPELAGPDERQVPELARRLLRARGQRRLVPPLRGPGAVRRAVAGGALLPTGPGPRGTQTFEQWLEPRSGAFSGRPARVAA